MTEALNVEVWPRSAAIVGLGLMGGSLARDLAARGVRVYAHDLDVDVLDRAIGAGVVHGRLADDLDGAAAAELAVIATPVDVAPRILERLAPVLRDDALVTDLGSTKRGIRDRAAALGLADRFVGSHPLAGDHRYGWEASRPGLYEAAPVFVCPSELDPAEPHAGADPVVPPRPAVASIAAFWRSLGAHTIILDADEHDRRMAWVSHLPQLLASTLALTLAGAGQSPARLGAGGRDMTRLAASSPEMWAAICRANSDLIQPAMGQLQQRLASFGEALADPDPEALLALFRSARDWTR